MLLINKGEYKMDTTETIIARLRKSIENISTILNKLEKGLDNQDYKIEFDENNEFELSFASFSAYFKGKKPLLVSFSSGKKVEVKTWKSVALEIMKECNSDKIMHERLIKISGKVFGAKRTLLAKSPNELDAPLKIDDDLYLETKFDTQSLFDIMKNRIFDVIGFDYGSIYIKYYDPALQNKYENKIDSPTMQ